MNVVLLKKEDLLEDSTVELDGRRAAHVSDVLRLRPGDELRVGILDGLLGKGEVVAVESGKVVLRVAGLSEPPPPPSAVELIVAMQRPKTMRKIFQSAAAMGVKRFFVVETWKVEKSYWSSPLLRGNAWEEELMLGLEQACDTVLPEVAVRRRFKPFVEDELPVLLADSEGFVAHPAASTPCPREGRGKRRLLAVGPEGGFTDYEVAKLAEAGMTPISLGARPLRSEFAVTALLALLG